MSKIERTGEISGKSAQDLYEASITAFEHAGFDVWKKRPLAWLALAKKTVEGIEVDSNLSARPTMPPSFALMMSAEGLSEEELSQLAEQFLAAYRAALSD